MGSGLGLRQSKSRIPSALLSQSFRAGPRSLLQLGTPANVRFPPVPHAPRNTSGPRCDQPSRCHCAIRWYRNLSFVRNKYPLSVGLPALGFEAACVSSGVPDLGPLQARFLWKGGPPNPRGSTYQDQDPGALGLDVGTKSPYTPTPQQSLWMYRGKKQVRGMRGDLERTAI